MPIYWQDDCSVHKMGQRLILLNCEKCKEKYCYLITRIAKGWAIAPYGFGREAMKTQAQDRCRQNLHELLRDGEEAVPCPKCNWVKEKLAKKYVGAGYIGLERLAWVLGFIGIASFFISLAFLFFGPSGNFMGTV